MINPSPDDSILMDEENELPGMVAFRTGALIRQVQELERKLTDSALLHEQQIRQLAADFQFEKTALLNEIHYLQFMLGDTYKDVTEAFPSPVSINNIHTTEVSKDPRFGMTDNY